MKLLLRFLPLMVFAPGVAQIPPPEIQQKIAPLFEQARTAERAGDLERALDYYDQALRLGPGVAEIWANKGLVLHRLDRPADALKAFLEASRIKPQLFTPALLAGIEYLQLGQPRQALESLRNALRLDPNSSEARLQLSRAHLQLGQFAQAADLLQALVEREPRNDQYWYQLGTTYLRWCNGSGQTLTDGDSGYGMMLRAEMSSLAGRPEVAKSRYQSAAKSLGSAATAEIPLDPETVRIIRGQTVRQPAERITPGPNAPPSRWIDAAVAAWREDRYQDSVRNLQSALKSSPQNPRALYWLTLTTRVLARESFLQAVAIDPNSWRAHWVLAETAARQSDQQTALKEFQSAVNLAPNEPEPRLAQVQYLVGIEKLQEAEQLVREGLNQFPAHPELNLELARLLLQSGQSKDALPYLEKAATDAGLPAARRDLAEVYAELGDFGKAIDAMLPILSTDLDGSLHYKLARWYRETGQVEKSKEALAETARLKARKIDQDQQVLK